MLEAGSLLQIPEMDKKGNTQPSQRSTVRLEVVGWWRGMCVKGSHLQAVFPRKVALFPTKPQSHAIELKSQFKVQSCPEDVSMLFLSVPPSHLNISRGALGHSLAFHKHLN